MIFIGVDAAWGDVNETGVVALEHSGHVRDAGWAIGVDAAVAWISAHAEPDTLVFIDAPLVVTNPTGQRSARPTSASATGVGASQRTPPTQPADGSAGSHCSQRCGATASATTTASTAHRLRPRRERVLPVYDNRRLRALRLRRAAALQTQAEGHARGRVPGGQGGSMRRADPEGRGARAGRSATRPPVARVRPGSCWANRPRSATRHTSTERIFSTQPSAPGRHRSGTDTGSSDASARRGTGRGATGGDDHRTSAARAAHRLTTADAPHSEP